MSRIFEALQQRIRRRSRLRIDPYRSFGTPDALRFSGRVLANRALAPATPGEHRRQIVRRMLARFATREVAGIEVAVTLGTKTATAISDSEGYFSAVLPAPESSGDVSQAAWYEATGSLPDGTARSPDAQTLWSLCLSPHTPRLVISDVDDTLLQNAAGDTLGTVLATIGGSVLTRKPVPGAPEAYREITEHGSVPVLYVSSSPWNIHDFLDGFLTRHTFPTGPLLLRDFGFNRQTLGSGHGSHKLDAIRSIAASCPSASIVLIGDTSLQDPEAFESLIDELGDRVVGAFVLDVGDDIKRQAAEARSHATDGRLVVIDDMTAIAPELDRRNWFDPDRATSH